jgi:NF-kappa-B inhibitor-like protein 1
LKTDVDVLLPNKDGQLPIHLACYYAEEGHQHAETDLILPLIQSCPSSLDIEDNNGVTARQLLQDVKDRLRQKKHRQRHERQSCPSFDEVPSFSESKSWEDKLADELEAECSEAWGTFEQDFSADERDAETWDSWAERMFAEHSAQAHYRRSTPHAPAPMKRKSHLEDKSAASGYENEIPKISDEKRKKFERKMAAAQKEHREQIDLRRRDRIVEQKLNYERACNALYKTGNSTLIGYDDVPWPHPPGQLAVQLRDSVIDYLFSDLTPGSSAYRSYSRLQRIRWHPDRFLHRCSARIKAEDRDRILTKVNEISQILNEFCDRLESKQ